MVEPDQQLDDAQLTTRILAGDASAFRTLYYRYGQALFGWLWQRTHDREAAEDLMQELFARVWRKRANLDPKQSVRAYLYQAANHLAIDHLRKKVRENEGMDEAQMPEATTVIQELDFERKAAIQKAIAALPEGQRTVFLLSRFEGLKYAEIATALGLSVKTVETHMSRALKKLREALKSWATSIVFLMGFWG